MDYRAQFEKETKERIDLYDMANYAYWLESRLEKAEKEIKKANKDNKTLAKDNIDLRSELWNKKKELMEKNEVLEYYLSAAEKNGIAIERSARDIINKYKGDK
jgi:hypothetical protein